jgi:hypothetical protein
MACYTGPPTGEEEGVERETHSHRAGGVGGPGAAHRRVPGLAGPAAKAAKRWRNSDRPDRRGKRLLAAHARLEKQFGLAAEFCAARGQAPGAPSWTPDLARGTGFQPVTPRRLPLGLACVTERSAPAPGAVRPAFPPQRVAPGALRGFPPRHLRDTRCGWRARVRRSRRTRMFRTWGPASPGCHSLEQWRRDLPPGPHVRSRTGTGPQRPPRRGPVSTNQTDDGEKGPQRCPHSPPTPRRRHGPLPLRVCRSP